MNILIVEDEQNLANEMESFLTKEGYSCKVARNGREASEEIFVNAYDFVLLDLGLPDYDRICN
jgi:DNA-binding response OmpR family regulator